MIRSSSPTRLAAVVALLFRPLTGLWFRSSLVSHGCAVVARIGCAQPVTVFRINGDGVDQAHVPNAARGVAAGVQRGLQAVWKSALHQNAIGDPLMMESRRIDGGLRLHADANPVRNAEVSRGDGRGSTGIPGH